MAEIWKEVYKAKRKGGSPPDADRNHMWGFPLPPCLPQTLSPREVWYVRVCSFTFVFHTPDQLEACLAFYTQKTHSSSRIPETSADGNYNGDNGERQMWFDRLPMYLLEEPKRKKVVAALRLAARQWTEE
jgi:hypothetical protein